MPASLAQGSRTGQPFAGVWLGDSEQGGAVVADVVAGPAAIAGLRRGDRIVQVDRIEVDAATAYGMFESSSPGDRLALVVMRDNQPVSMTLVIDSRERWAAPSAFQAVIPFAATGLSESHRSADRIMEQALSALPDAEPIVASLERMFIALARDDTGYHKLPLIRSAFLDPNAMDRWRDALAQTLHPFEFDRQAIVAVMCETLALTCPAPVTHSSAPLTLEAFAQAVGNANTRVRDVFAAANADRTQAHADLHYLMRTTAVDRTLIAQPDTLRGIRAMQLSMRVDSASLLEVGRDLIANANRLPDSPGPARQPPAELRDAVEGSIIDSVAGGLLSDAVSFDIPSLDGFGLSSLVFTSTPDEGLTALATVGPVPYSGGAGCGSGQSCAGGGCSSTGGASYAFLGVMILLLRRRETQA